MIEARYWSDNAISTQILESAPALPGALDDFRSRLSRGWSRATAYSGTITRAQWNTGNSRGQCGVSSAWLAEVLAREYSICSTFCQGSLLFDEEESENLCDHCWLEIDGAPGEALILDLTCDQAQGFDRQIVFDSKTKLAREGVHYISHERVSIFDLPSNPVWPRYQRLLRNIS